MLKRWIAVTVSTLSVAIVVPLAVASGGLSGTYRTTISQPTSIKGNWSVKFASGQTTVSRNGQLVVHGHYSLAGSTITFKDGKNCHNPAKYSYALSGKTLTFTKISDPCTSNRHLILAHTFTRI